MTASLLRPARQLVEPTWSHVPDYAATYGPLVAELCQRAQFGPDPEQQLALDAIFGVRLDGLSAAVSTDVIAARRNLKTGLLIQTMIGWLYVTEEPRVTYSAHRLDATKATFEKLHQLIRGCPALSRRLKPSRVGRPDEAGVTKGNGQWALELATGQKVTFMCRSRNGARGMEGKLILDEGFALTPALMGAIVPIVAAEPDPQTVTASSGGLRESSVLRDKRDRGRAGTSPDQAYFEWGDPNAHEGCAQVDCQHEKSAAGCVLDDEDRLRATNPALASGRITLRTLRALRQDMPPDEFAREFLVWWDDPPHGEAGPAISPARWRAARNPAAETPHQAGVVLDVAPDRKRSSIGVAADGSAGRTLVMCQTLPGTDHVVSALVSLMARRDVTEVALHPRSQAAVLIPALDRAGVEWVPLTSSDQGAACAWFTEAVNAPGEQLVEHLGQPELDAAVANARTRMTAGEVELWDARDASVDISPLRACSIAAHRWQTANNGFNIW